MSVADWHRLFGLECGVRHYAWGARTQHGRPPYIASLLGLPAASVEHRPCAELWVGAHASSPAKVWLATGAMGLDALIAQHPAAILGSGAAVTPAPGLPFLLQVLD